MQTLWTQIRLNIREHPDQDSLCVFPEMQKESEVHLDIIYILYAADVEADIIFRTKY